jgi:hypothetical protein
MTDNDARRDALATWFLEFSVLWAVFPVLDQLVEHHPLDVQITVVSAGVALTTGAVGVILKRGDHR